MVNSINILGTRYRLRLIPFTGQLFNGDLLLGRTEEHQRIIEVVDSRGIYPNEPRQYHISEWKKTIRHEIIHAFLNESGLTDCALQPRGSWARNEEMVDWFAIQGPKIVQAWSIGEAWAEEVYQRTSP